MSNASLTLIGVRGGINKEDVQSGLAKLYGKPESHFEPHCQHLFELKKPYKLLKKVDAAEAEKHLEKLEALGIQCQLKSLEPSAAGLSLVPIKKKDTAEDILCPACDQTTVNVEICDQCGVIMAKFAKQKNIEKMLPLNPQHDNSFFKNSSL